MSHRESRFQRHRRRPRASNSRLIVLVALLGFVMVLYWKLEPVVGVFMDADSTSQSAPGDSTGPEMDTLEVELQ